MENMNWITIPLVILLGLMIGSWISHRPLKTKEVKDGEKVIYRSLAPLEGWEKIHGEEKIILLDVRTADEYKNGHMVNSLNIPIDKLPHKAVKKFKDPAKTILVYCQSGARSKKATKLLYENGFTNVYDIGAVKTFFKHQPKKPTEVKE